MNECSLYTNLNVGKQCGTCITDGMNEFIHIQGTCIHIRFV